MRPGRPNAFKNGSSIICKAIGPEEIALQVVYKLDLKAVINMALEMLYFSDTGLSLPLKQVSHCLFNVGLLGPFYVFQHWALPILIIPSPISSLMD